LPVIQEDAHHHARSSLYPPTTGSEVTCDPPRIANARYETVCTESIYLSELLIVILNIVAKYE